MDMGSTTTDTANVSQNDNIDDMTGPALAEAVARRVMGWWQGRSGICWYDTDSTDGKFKVGVVDYRPDLSIAQAWEVVQKMQQLGYGVRISDKDQDKYWWCYFNPDHVGQGSAAGEAICRAALKAIQP